MEYGDKKLCQSITIARFLANEFGIAGKNNMEKAEADMIVDTIVDVQIGNQCHFYVFEIFYINIYFSIIENLDQNIVIVFQSFSKICLRKILSKRKSKLTNLKKKHFQGS